MKIVLDAKCMEEKETAHAYLKEKLNFPDYYGRNLDALSDCLTDLADTQIVLVHTGSAEGYFKPLFHVLRQAGRCNPDLQIIVPEETYRVVALDMDGTALNSRKELTPRLIRVIHEAMAAGKEVVFCTGRSFDEMKDILAEFPEMNYLCGESGALLYHVREQRIEKAVHLSAETIRQIRGAMADKDYMPQIMTGGRTMINESQLHRIDEYSMGAFQEFYSRVVTPVKDVMEMAASGNYGIEKLNLHHRSPDDREDSLKRLQELGLQIPMVYSEIAALECSAEGVNKASGLQGLCELMGITMEEVVMVGDADNDLTALKAAGLAVAMGNANENVRAACHDQVADNDNDGCAEAIERFLLGR